MKEVWKKDDISNKWPAARLLGPNVEVEQALDFIWLTDYALQEPGYCTNDRQFSEELSDWLGCPSFDRPHSGNRGEHLSKHEEWCEKKRKRNLVELSFLSSNWVASSYVFGPHGPVHPDGKVKLHVNFGKWPSIDEVEIDLETIAEVFPWLSFTLALWDSQDESDSVERGDEPDFAWKLHGGQFERIPASLEVFGDFPIPKESSIEEALSDLGRPFNDRRETTWTMDQIRKMWGRYL